MTPPTAASSWSTRPSPTPIRSGSTGQPTRKHQQHHKVSADEAQTPLIAKPYTQGVRPGRTTRGARARQRQRAGGQPLAVTAVGQPDQQGVTVSVAPDAQTVLATVTAALTRRRALPVHDRRRPRPYRPGEVTLVPRSPGQNSRAELRRDYQPPSLTVASGEHWPSRSSATGVTSTATRCYVDSGAVSASAGIRERHQRRHALPTPRRRPRRARR